MSQSSGINEVVKVVDHLHVLNGRLDTLLTFALKPGALLNCERTRQIKVSDESSLRRKLSKSKWGMTHLSLGISTDEAI